VRTTAAGRDMPSCRPRLKGQHLITKGELIEIKPTLQPLRRADESTLLLNSATVWLFRKSLSSSSNSRSPSFYLSNLPHSRSPRAGRGFCMLSDFSLLNLLIQRRQLFTSCLIKDITLRQIHQPATTVSHQELVGAHLVVR